jgi:hypothetical protein
MYTLVGFGPRTHSSTSRVTTTRPRRQGSFYVIFISKFIAKNCAAVELDNSLY